MEKSYRLQAVKRNILYWGRTTEQIVLFIIAICLFYTVIFGALKSGGGNAFSDTIRYITMVGPIFSLIAPVSYGGSYLQLAISFGARRSETVWGVQFMLLFLLIQEVLLYFVWSVIGTGYSGNTWLGAGGLAILLLYASAAGQFACSVYLKYGSKGMIFFILILVGAGVLIIFLGVNVITKYGGSIANLFLKFTEFLGGGISAMMAISGSIALLLYAASIAVFKKVLKNYEVRR